MEKQHWPLKLFAGYGLELEYMIVDERSLDIRPVADKVLAAAAGEEVNEVELGPIAWSNELVLHVLELKVNGPAKTLNGLAELFADHINKANALLKPLGCRLMPSAMHPWMLPLNETRIWPHEQNEIYRSYDRIFGVKGHGWANLQSTHINLPFSDNEEFVRLHAAIRAVLPLIPALAASSPITEGKVTGFLDTRLETYRLNQKAIPSIAGKVIPEIIRSIDEYHERIFKVIYNDIAPHDPDKIMRYEWLNSRGAIARFMRGALEIRIVDIQECPRADIAIVAAIVAAVRALAEERWLSIDDLHQLAAEPLEQVFLAAIKKGGDTSVTDERHLAAFGLKGKANLTVKDIWRHLIDTLIGNDLARSQHWAEVYQVLADHGPLANRILTACGNNPDKKRLVDVYGKLCECLSANRIFVP